MDIKQSAKIQGVDVAVVGGGIAGVAIAEYLARHTELSIQLLEQEAQLGGGASGKLEGWFHTGALYSGQDDGQTFMNCVNGVEDLLNHYHSHFAPHCNFHLEESGPQRWRPAVFPQPGGWFDPNPVYLIHPQGQAPEIQQSGLKGDRVQLEWHLKRVLGRLERAYGQGVDWRSPTSDQVCQAPSYETVEQEEKIPSSLDVQPEAILDYCRRCDQTYGQPPSDYRFLQGLDCAMDTHRILWDLTASFLAHQGAIATGITLQHIETDRYGPLRIKSLLYQDHQGQRHYLKAQVFIFAVGAAFDAILPTLQVRAKLKRSRSTMIVAYPALSPHNFVRMSTKNPFHFNHFYQPLRQGVFPPGEGGYSMVANSGYVSEENPPQALALDGLVAMAERYFDPQTLYQRHLWGYDCTKTEFISDDEQKRRYSYWIESDPQSNYLCVLPGKFSFFPTVAVQTAHRLQSLLPPSLRRERPSPNPITADYRAGAKQLVARPYPHQLVASLFQP